MAYTEITKRADVLGHPAIHKTATGDPVVSPGELARLVGEADDAFKAVTALDAKDLNADFVQKAASMGFPVHNIRNRAVGVADTMQKFTDALGKLGIDADTIKEITLSGIGNWTQSDGPWLYDLEAPSKKVFPVLSPLRNKTLRTRGVGTSKRFRRIDGISGSQTGGVANFRMSMNESVSETFRGLALNRPKKISYATSLGQVTYKLQGLSDDLTWASQFAGQGFEDLHGLISANVLRAHMMAEEQLLLAGRTTAISAPTLTAGNLTSRAAAAGETGLSGGNTSVYVKVTAIGHFGESVLSAAATVAYTGGNVIDVTLNTLPAGAHGFRVYASTGAADPGDAARWKCVWQSGPLTGLDYTGGNLFTISGALPTSGTAASTIVADTTASADDYDGYLTQTMASGLSVARLNANLSLDAITKNVFLPGWTQYKADVDEAWCHALESVKITDLVLGASGTPYRITVPEGSEGSVVGNYRVSRLINKVTGKEVAVTVHPYIEQGNMLFLSYTLPFPYSEVPNVWELALVQDYLQIDWPVIQMSYDVSTFTMGALVGYAPVYNAALTGIQGS